MLVVVYEEAIEHLASLVLIALLVWGVLWWATTHRRLWRRVLVAVNALLSVAAIYGVLSLTAFGRVSNGEHIFVLSLDPAHEEFLREMFMNALLYLPLGLALSALIGPWVVLVGLALSIGIEWWQYVACTGTAQCTDVLCNTFGCTIGVMPRIWVDFGLWNRLLEVLGKLRGGSGAQQDA